MPIPLEHFLLIGAFLFCMGLIIIITKRNAVMILIGIELILNASNINLIAFSQYDAHRLQGQMFSMFVIVVAAAEAVVALAIVMQVYKHFQTIDLDEVKDIKD